jgi:osmotically-inducible protein OsmY
MGDRRLEAEIRHELAVDPRVEDPGAIAIAADAGFVSVRGTVASMRQRRAVLHRVERSHGVMGIGDRLRVHIGAGPRRGDIELRGAALQALVDAPELAADWLDVEVADGWATLKGNVAHQRQSDIAFSAVAALHDIAGLSNAITVTAQLRDVEGRRRASS